MTTHAHLLQSVSFITDLINIFQVFLPQLLLYPNPGDPLNGEAAALLLKDEDKYKKKVQEYVKAYAADASMTDTKAESEDDDDLSLMSDASQGDVDETDFFP